MADSKNKEKIKARAKEYYAKDPDRWIKYQMEYQKTYREEHKDKRQDLSNKRVIVDIVLLAELIKSGTVPFVRHRKIYIIVGINLAFFVWII